MLSSEENKARIKWRTCRIVSTKLDYLDGNLATDCKVEKAHSFVEIQ